MYNGRRAFKHGRAMPIVVLAVTALFAAATYGAYTYRGWTWVSVSMALATLILGPGAIIESVIARVELTDDTLVATDLRGRRRYARVDIEKVEETRGAPTAIKLKSGPWVKLPSVGSDMGNSIRAWLKG